MCPELGEIMLLWVNMRQINGRDVRESKNSPNEYTYFEYVLTAGVLIEIPLFMIQSNNHCSVAFQHSSKDSISIAVHETEKQTSRSQSQQCSVSRSNNPTRCRSLAQLKHRAYMQEYVIAVQKWSFALKSE